MAAQIGSDSRPGVLVSGVDEYVLAGKLEQFRVALAHRLLYGMTVLPQAHHHLHGEVVSYGLVVQSCLEKNEEELGRLIPFFSKLGLPLTLEVLWIHDIEELLFREGIRRSCAKRKIARLVSSVPLSLTIIGGLPRSATIASSSRATRAPDSDVSTTSARFSRVK